MEEHIGYEDLFSADEWASLGLNDWDTDDLSSGATTSGSGSVAQDSQMASGETPSHSVTIDFPPGQFFGNEDRFELTCDRCGFIKAVATFEEAQAIAKIHEVLIAVLVDAMEAK